MTYLQGDYVEARQLYEQSLEIKERLGDQGGKASSLGQLGIIAYEKGDLKRALALTIQTFLLLDALHAPARATALRMLAGIRKRMDEDTFMGHWRALAGERPLPGLPQQDPESTFFAALNDLCGQVVRALGTGGAEQRAGLSIQIDRMMQGDLPVEGARAFLQVLNAWLRGQNAQALERQGQALPSPFREAYKQMVSAVEQETIPSPVAADPEEASEITIGDLPHAVADTILHGTAEQRQQFAVSLEETRQQLPAEAALLSRFLGCLAAALRDETPESAALEAPFTDLWQAFLEALQTGKDEQEEESKENDA